MKQKILAIAITLQLSFGLIAEKSNAFIIGALTGSVAVSMIGWGVGVGGWYVGRYSRDPNMFNKGLFLFFGGIILDEKIPASHEIEFDKITPETLALAYDERTAHQIWSELATMDRELVGQVFEVKYPEQIQKFLKNQSACNSACRKEIKLAEKQIAATLQTEMQTAVSAKRAPGNAFELSMQTTRYVMEQATGYTFLSTEKELSK